MLIACCGDTDRPVFRRVVQAIRERSPDLILFAGDVRADGFGVGRRHAKRWCKQWGDLAGRVLAVPGNHDYAKPEGPAWAWRGSWPGSDGFELSPDNRSFVLHRGPVSIVGFDSGPFAAMVDDIQIDWAEARLQEEPAAMHRIAVVHSPAFPVSHHIGSSLDAVPSQRDALWTRLEALGVGLVLSGHEHLYARRTLDFRSRIVQVITGGGGAELSPIVSADIAEGRSAHHALFLHNRDEEGLHGEAFLINGELVDRFLIQPRSGQPLGRAMSVSS